MGRLVLGLDIGITSVGYGVIDIDENDFVDYGVRLFKAGTAAENETRRTARGRRRLVRRKQTRLRDMSKLLEENGIKTKDYHPLNNVYEIRVKGLNQKLSDDELTAALLHLTKHRGTSFDTVNDKEDDSDAEEMKSILSSNKKDLAGGKYVCEIQSERLNETGSVRGHGNLFRTEDYIKEAKQILSNQELPEELENKILDIIQRKRAYYEGPGSEVSPTPYGRFIEVDGQIQKIDLIEKMTGKCSVFPDELRAPKMSVSAEVFNLLNDINNMTVRNEKLEKPQKEEIFSFVGKRGNITFKQLLNLLQVDEKDVRGYRIDKNHKPLLTEFKGYKKLRKLFDKHGYSVSLDDYEMLDSIAEIITKQKGIKEREKSLRELDYQLNSGIIEELANLTGFSGYHSLSFKALRMINKEMMETPMNQMQVLYELELFDKNRKSYKGQKNILPDRDAILSPVAKRAQNEAFKVINALRKKYGEFDSIVVEMTRDKNDKEQKKRIEDRQKWFESRNKEVDKLLEDMGYNPEKIPSKTKAKIRLYLEQDCKSAYTFQELDLGRIISDESYTEIDHILPISISLDDSQSNKVLASRAENQAKGNLSPIMAYQRGKFNGMGCTLAEYISLVQSSKKIGYKKKGNLLYDKDLMKYENIKEFINRNLVDTSYACRTVLNTLSNYFKDNEINTKVHTINGRLTDRFRTQINLQKQRDEDYLHHAVDALIVASIKKLGLLDSYLAKYSFDRLYDEETGEIKEIPEDDAFFDNKYIQFILNLRGIYEQSNRYYYGLTDLEDMVYPPIKISHKVDTKPNRQISDETIYSTRNVDGQEMLVEKIKNIYDPKDNACKRLVEDILNGDTDKYLMAQHNPQTFDEIKRIITNHYDQCKDSEDVYSINKKGKIELKGENPLAAYNEEFGPVRKHSKKGNGPVVISMKYLSEKLGNHLDITFKMKDSNNKVIMKQIRPYRTDFYQCEDGYRFVTIRYKDVFFSKTKNKYFIKEDWYQKQKTEKGVKENDVFLFSLHHDELIGIVREEGKTFYYDSSTEHGGEKRYHNGKNEEVMRFVATNNDKKERIQFSPIFTYCKKQLLYSVRNVSKIRKIATDILGNIYEVKENVLKLEFD